MNQSALLCVSDLSIQIDRDHLLRDVSFELHAGECLTLLGESGAGKSLLARAIMGNLPSTLRASGQISIAGQTSAAERPATRRPLWGHTLTMLPQEPSLALDPLMRVQPQLREVYEQVGSDSRDNADKRARQVLRDAGLAEAGQRYPWQISGGMAQRAAASISLAGGATILLADEPTKGLDRYWCDQTIGWLQRVQRAGGCVLIITHDLRVARALGGWLMVLKNGEVIEHGQTRVVLDAPRHTFTRRLIEADPSRWATLPTSTAGSRVLRARQLSKRFGGRQLFDSLDLDIHRRERIVLQGSSGVGKSTLGNILLGLLPADQGMVLRDAGLPRHALQKLYQDPVTSFAPQQPLQRLLRDVMELHRQPWSRLLERLERLGVSPALLMRRPNEISGGELQRMAMARVLAAQPALLFADEPTSRLDPVTQQEALRLLLDCVAECDAALMLVTHDDDIASWLATRTLRFGDDGLDGVPDQAPLDDPGSRSKAA
ncbi:MAG: ATP-binding cassette domain-containing protein [Lautropia sp.]|nr:ATP-binding cassette domain-containing protein [Lautropia sp.]